MKQDNISEATRKAIERPRKITRSAMEQSKKLRTPSPEAAKTGTAVGSCVGAGLFLAGVVCLFTGRTLWAFGTVSAGAAALISNFICRHKKK